MALLTVTQICSKYDLSPVYVKRALQKGWLAPASKKLMQGTKVMQWVVEDTVVIAWRKSAEEHKASKGGFSGTAKQLRDVRAFLQTQKKEDIAKLRKSLPELDI